MINIRKFLLGLLLIIIISLMIALGLEAIKKSEIRKDVLSQLEERLEFCEIIKEEFGEDWGKFWMMCNSRPLEAKYSKGKLMLELNGWSFIQEDEVLAADLLNCDFYDTKEDDVVFYCPMDFLSGKLTAKIYSFDKENFILEKKEEKDFLDIVGNDIKESYSFLSSCDVEGFKSIGSVNYPSILSVYFNCENDNDYVVYTDFATIPIQPPVLVRTDLSNEEAARTSFEKAFGFEIDEIEAINENTILIKSSKLEATYIFSDTGTVNVRYNINSIENDDELKAAVKEFSLFFVFPLSSNIQELTNLGEIYEDVVAFKAGSNIISVNYSEELNVILAFWKKTNGFYR